jgi:hypothetical protein
LIIEAEFARTISVMERLGNTLSAILRAAWDRGHLEILTKTSAAHATDAHVSVVGHITLDELRARFTSTEQSNGFGNRFLFGLVKRSQCCRLAATWTRQTSLRSPRKCLRRWPTPRGCASSTSPMTQRRGGKKSTNSYRTKSQGSPGR